jgi:hypothetical protein
MRRAVVLLLLVLSTTGCARAYWTKAGFNQADWNRDSYECERDMRQSGYYGTGLFGALNAQNFEERCLVAKGYYRVTASAPAAAPQYTEPGDPIPYDPDHCRICPDCASCKGH